MESCNKRQFPPPRFLQQFTSQHSHLCLCEAVSKLEKIPTETPSSLPIKWKIMVHFQLDVWRKKPKQNQTPKILTVPGKREVLNIHQNRNKFWIMQVGRSIWIPFPKKCMLASGLTAQTISWASTAESCHTSGDLATYSQFRYIPSSSSLSPAGILVTQAEVSIWHKRQELMAHIAIAYNDTHACSPWILKLDQTQQNQSGLVNEKEFRQNQKAFYICRYIIWEIFEMLQVSGIVQFI